jgi:hypothetical protein
MRADWHCYKENRENLIQGLVVVAHLLPVAAIHTLPFHPPLLLFGSRLALGHDTVARIRPPSLRSVMSLSTTMVALRSVSHTRCWLLSTLLVLLVLMLLVILVALLLLVVGGLAVLVPHDPEAVSEGPVPLRAPLQSLLESTLSTLCRFVLLVDEV